jgi:hypothetical protein
MFHFLLTAATNPDASRHSTMDKQLEKFLKSSSKKCFPIMSSRIVKKAQYPIKTPL